MLSTELIRKYFDSLHEFECFRLEWMKCSSVLNANSKNEKVIEEAEQYNNGWIPADEPPKDDNYVLLSFENFSLPLVGRYESDGKGGGSYYIGDCDEEDTCIANYLYVNAWQPLPQPFQKGE